MPNALSKIQLNFCIQINWQWKSVLTELFLACGVGSELLLSRTEAETASTLEITVKKCFKTERLTTGKNIYFSWRLNGVLI